MRIRTQGSGIQSTQPWLYLTATATIDLPPPTYLPDALTITPNQDLNPVGQNEKNVLMRIRTQGSGIQSTEPWLYLTATATIDYTVAVATIRSNRVQSLMRLVTPSRFDPIQPHPGSNPQPSGTTHYHQELNR